MRSFTHTIAFGRIIVAASAHIATYMMSQLRLTSNGSDQWEDKSSQNSTADVSFCTIIIIIYVLSHCMTAITMV